MADKCTLLDMALIMLQVCDAWTQWWYCVNSSYAATRWPVWPGRLCTCTVTESLAGKCRGACLQVPSQLHLRRQSCRCSGFQRFGDVARRFRPDRFPYLVGIDAQHRRRTGTVPSLQRTRPQNAEPSRSHCSETRQEGLGSDRNRASGNGNSHRAAHQVYRHPAGPEGGRKDERQEDQLRDNASQRGNLLVCAICSPEKWHVTFY